MHEWGEDLLVESYRLPWLIWIQLLVLFLILLLSYFGLFDLDFTADSSSFATAAPSLPPAILSFNCEQETPNCSQVAGNQETEAENARVRRRDDIPGEGGREATSSTKDPRRLYHPCHYFELAKQAFLQCLGLGSPPRTTRMGGRTEIPDSRKQRGNEE